jgi:SAM-dependent methyltransferase
MEHADLVDLIRGGVQLGAGHWADLGAGTGNFTAALADLLGPGAHIVAVDRDRGALRTLTDRLGGRDGLALEARVADFTEPLGLGGLDGILMANSLHFVRDKLPVLAQVHDSLRPGGTLLIVEYDADRGNPWVPHPFSFSTWTRLAEAAGFTDTHQVGYLPSRHLGGMYAAAGRISAGL